MPAAGRVRGHAILAAVLVLIASLRIVSTYGALSHTMDEPEHIGDGIQWLSGHGYDWDVSHPPLERMFSAVSLYLDGVRYVPADGGYAEGLKLLGRDAQYDRVLAQARLGVLPLFWIASLAVFFWARRAGGEVAALVAVFLFTTLPPVLAHAGLVTTDLAATAMAAVAFAATEWWAEQPSRGRTFVFGLTLGLAALAKFSLLVYLPAGWLLLLVWRRPSWSAVRSRLAPLAGAAAVGALLIWAGYRFSLDGPLPAPEFFAGVRSIWQHNVAGHSSYILGQRHHNGVWYYFPVTLAVKTPLAFLILLVWSLGKSWRARLPVAAAVAFAAGILLVAMSSRINIGVRHVLPIYAALAVICAVGAAELLRPDAGRAALLRAIGVLVLCSAQAFSGAFQHPDYIAYTNEIAWSHPENFVAESDLDWGQDMKRVAAFLASVGAKQVAFTPYCGTYLIAGEAFPKTTPTDWYHPLPGWNVVSLSGLKVYNHPGWANDRKPQVVIGRTHWAWYFP